MSEFRLTGGFARILKLSRFCEFGKVKAMKIEVTWNKPDGEKAVITAESVRTDPEMELHKTVAASFVYFDKKFGTRPAPDELTARIIE